MTTTTAAADVPTTSTANNNLLSSLLSSVEDSYIFVNENDDDNDGNITNVNEMNNCNSNSIYHSTMEDTDEGSSPNSNNIIIGTDDDDQETFRTPMTLHTIGLQTIETEEISFVIEQIPSLLESTSSYLPSTLRIPPRLISVPPPPIASTTVNIISPIASSNLSITSSDEAKIDAILVRTTLSEYNNNENWMNNNTNTHTTMLHYSDDGDDDDDGVMIIPPGYTEGSDRTMLNSKASVQEDTSMMVLSNSQNENELPVVLVSDDENICRNTDPDGNSIDPILPSDADSTPSDNTNGLTSPICLGHEHRRSSDNEELKIDVSSSGLDKQEIDIPPASNKERPINDKQENHESYKFISEKLQQHSLANSLIGDKEKEQSLKEIHNRHNIQEPKTVLSTNRELIMKSNQDSTSDDESENTCNSTTTTTTTTIVYDKSDHSRTTIHHKNYKIDHEPINNSNGTFAGGECSPTPESTTATCRRDSMWKSFGEITLVVATAAIGAAVGTAAYQRSRKRKS